MADSRPKQSNVPARAPRKATSGSFKPGVSGNPGGRIGVPSDVREAARALTPKAIARLEYWMDSTHPTASMAATIAVMERAWGKPTQPLDGDGDGGPIKLVISWERS